MEEDVGVFEGKLLNACVLCGRGSAQILQMVTDEVNAALLQASWHVIHLERLYVQVSGQSIYSCFIEAGKMIHLDLSQYSSEHICFFV